MKGKASVYTYTLTRPEKGLPTLFGGAEYKDVVLPLPHIQNTTPKVWAAK
ncbi:MAG: hypothetical protein KBC96_03675 [Armatimonadetes bacterium]|nr:hypothetical protein [Armatimonadota bacterium]